MSNEAQEAFEARHGRGTWHSLEYPFPLLREEWQAGRASRAQEAPAQPSDGERDLAALVGRLVRRLREVNPDDNLAATATDYLQRKRYLSPLRIHANASLPLPAAPEQQLPPRLKSTPYGPAILLDDVRDAQRMDWLERQDLNNIATIRQTNSVVGINAGSGPFYGKTLRAAIDAAIAAAPKEPE